MKKLIITTLAVTALAASAFSQGLVGFAGGGNTATRVSTNSVVGGAATGQTAATAGLYYYALFASTTQTATAASGAGQTYVFSNLGSVATAWELVGIGANIASVGRYSGVSQGTSSAGQAALNADNSMNVIGIAGGGSANLVAVGWSANIGTTLAALMAWYAAPGITGWIGQSGTSTQVLGDGGQIPTPTTWNSSPTFLLGMVATPEPGTLALAALGGASLLLFRRKK
jgi:hypothetical protein